MVTIRGDIEQLRTEVNDLRISLPEFAEHYHVPLSALYRFSSGSNVKVNTLLLIEDAMVDYRASARKQRS